MSVRACARAWLAWLAGVLAVLGVLRASPARADEQPVVAVLPLSASNPRLGIYGAPVARAIAKHLRAQGRFRVEALALDDVLPQRVALVVDGRIVKASGSAVRLEARVRDPERGLTAAVVATGGRPLAEIDQLAEELARELTAPLDAAMAAMRRQEAAGAASGATRGTSSAASPSMGRAPSAPSGPSGSPAGDAAQRVRASAPPMAIFGASARPVGAVPVADVATRATEALARRLGFRPLPVATRGIAEAKAARAALAQAGAAYGLVLEVRDIELSRAGVLLARGRVRAVLIDAQGRRIYDGTRRTGTLVGSRGDHQAAMVRLVLEQATDMFAPDLARVLRRQPAPARGRSGSP
jgi:hypothetical protein